MWIGHVIAYVGELVVQWIEFHSLTHWIEGSSLTATKLFLSYGMPFGMG